MDSWEHCFLLIDGHSRSRFRVHWVSGQFKSRCLFSAACLHSVFMPSMCCADDEQCKYGKNRVEADAKRLQAKEDELMKKKQEIRNHLTQLKKERRDLRTAVEAAAGEKSEKPKNQEENLLNIFSSWILPD